MVIILKSNRKSSGCFPPDDFFIASKLISVSVERLKEIGEYCQPVDEKRMKSLMDTKAITYAEQDLIVFEDRTFIIKTTGMPIALASIYVFEKAGLETLKKFQQYILSRIDKIQQIKKLNSELLSLLKERKSIEFSIFSFSVPDIPNSLSIKQEVEFEIISKERIIGNQKITLEAKFYNNLLLAVTLIWHDKQILLRYKGTKDLDLLFSPSFYREVEKFLDEYPEIELQEVIKTINSLTSA